MEKNNINDSTETKHKKRSAPKTVSIRIPRISVPGIQSTFLILLIAVGALQTVQLIGLQQNIANANVSSSTNKTSATAPVSTATTGAPGGSGTALPKMVGGC